MTPTLLKALQKQLKVLVDDLRKQSETVPELRDLLRNQYEGARKGERTGASYEEWREDKLDEAAVAWLLGTVFVRFCEDNKLISGAWIAGPGEATEAAVQAQTAYFQRTKGKTDRDWILQGFEHLKQFAATAKLFDDRNPVWTHPISGDAATGLLHFWRRGAGVHSFTDDELDTRFLGDLYQDLSQHARKRYALLQTPEFVEEFILDLTLTPAIQEYGLEETSLIDPTCGSGHFLIGAFHRLYKLWLEREPGTDPRVRVQKALDQVTGVDINPFAVAIARFRLTIAALKACGEKSLESAPGFRIRVATGDSLLRWGKDTSHQGDLLAVLEGRNEFAYYTEDGDLLAEYLRPGQYTVAVGNPPYITVKDKTLNQRYRELYKTCSGHYALSVPFAERLFQLVRQPDGSGRAGFVGQITANSFMKREFGRKLIEDFLAHRVELSHVIDTSGAYIPGHGTPTVILIGRRRPPKRPTVRAVLGIVGEPRAPADPAKGLVWTAIVDNIASPTTNNKYVTVADLPRTTLSAFPWSLSGGGATDLMLVLEKAPGRLRQETVDSGFGAVTREDSAYMLGAGALRRLGIPEAERRMLVEGDSVRDWQLDGSLSIWPYDTRTLEAQASPRSQQALWPLRRILVERVAFGKTQVERGLKWFEYSMFFRNRFRAPILIAFAFVATHNHFVLDRGGKVFNRSAPVIMLSERATEDDHLGLLGLLNSSTACFWLKQVSHDKGTQGVNEGFKSQEWERFYEFTGTKLQEFPLPAGQPLARARALDGLAQRLAAARPGAVCATGVPSRKALDEARAEYDRIRGEMITIQEELDWEVYRLYGLLDDDLTAPTDAVPQLKLGERAFEIVLARKMAAGETQTQWFARHGSTPITEIPSHWPEEYRKVVQRRIQIIEERSDIALIERPECKRRWSAVPWEEQEKAALRDWLLDRLEEPTLWRHRGQARVLSVAQLADRIGANEDFRSVLALYCGRDDYDLVAELLELTRNEAVPYLAAYRYKPSGLRKRAVWERTWDLQRREDAGEKVGDIPVPPKYTQDDFAKPSYWRNRGKLDVPKERFILYPKAGRDADKTPVLGWAGWNHLDQADALANLYLTRKSDDGWPADRLLPLLAGLVELEPWLHQWHNEPDDTDESPAQYYTQFIDTELAALGHGRADLTADKLTDGTGTR